MGGIKYYNLALGEELPDEFCAVRDVGGEPSEYTFYVPESEAAKLREYVQTLEAANIDVTSRLQDYIGQYDPTDAFVIEAKAENAKLRRAFNETLIRLVAANDVAVSSYMDDEYLELMRELGIEVKP